MQFHSDMRLSFRVDTLQLNNQVSWIGYSLGKAWNLLGTWICGKSPNLNNFNIKRSKNFIILPLSLFLWFFLFNPPKTTVQWWQTTLSVQRLKDNLELCTVGFVSHHMDISLIDSCIRILHYNKVTTRWEGPQSLPYHKQWLGKDGLLLIQTCTSKHVCKYVCMTHIPALTPS